MYNNKEVEKMYDTIKIPHSLIVKVEKVVTGSGMGYRNRSEFIIEAVREKVLSLERQEVKA